MLQKHFAVHSPDCEARYEIFSRHKRTDVNVAILVESVDDEGEDEADVA